MSREDRVERVAGSEYCHSTNSFEVWPDFSYQIKYDLCIEEIISGTSSPSLSSTVSSFSSSDLLVDNSDVCFDRVQNTPEIDCIVGDIIPGTVLADRRVPPIPVIANLVYNTRDTLIEKNKTMIDFVSTICSYNLLLNVRYVYMISP